MEKEALNEYREELGKTLGEALITPTKIYVKALKAVKEAGITIKGCSHISEPDCGVKEALAEGKISPLRYENYKLLYEELKDVKKY